MDHVAQQRRGIRYLLCDPRRGREAKPFLSLRFSFVCALLVAMAGCRFNVEPAEISLTGNAGETASETLTIQNTGDELLSYTLTPSGSGFDLSSRSGSLEIGESIEISV